MKFLVSYNRLKRSATKASRPASRRRRSFSLIAWYHQIRTSTTVRISLVVAIVLFGVGYSVATSNVSTKGYEMKVVERQIAELKEHNQQLKLSIAQYRSLDRIEKRITALGMVPVDTIQYISTQGSNVAAR